MNGNSLVVWICASSRKSFDIFSVDNDTSLRSRDGIFSPVSAETLAVWLTLPVSDIFSNYLAYLSLSEYKGGGKNSKTKSGIPNYLRSLNFNC